MIAGVVVAAAAATALLYVTGWPASLYRDNDFASLWVMGRMLLDGKDQYDFDAYLAAHRAIASRALTIVVPGTPTFYPLTTALLMAPFALLPVALAAPLWLVIQIVLGLVALVALARVLFPSTLRRDLPVLVAFAASSQPAWLLAAGGNLGGFLLAIAAGAVTLLMRGRPYLAGALAGLLVVKPHPLLFALPIVLVALPPRAALRALAGALATAGALTLLSIALRPGWIAELAHEVTAITTYASRQATVFGLLGRDLVAVAWLVVVASVAIALVWARRRPPIAHVAAAAIPLSLFSALYGWSYDHLALFVTAAVVLALVADLVPRSRVAMLCVVAVVFVALPWALYGIAFRRGDESWSAVVPLAALATLGLASWLRARVSPSGGARAA